MVDVPAFAPYEVLRGQLRSLWRRAGKPSYRRMGVLWRHEPIPPNGPVTVFAAATIADNLNGKRRSMSAPFVRFFVLSCVVYARDNGITLPAADLRPGHWQDLWAAQDPADPAYPPNGVVETRPKPVIAAPGLRPVPDDLPVSPVLRPVHDRTPVSGCLRPGRHSTMVGGGAPRSATLLAGSGCRTVTADPVQDDQGLPAWLLAVLRLHVWHERRTDPIRPPHRLTGAGDTETGER